MDQIIEAVKKLAKNGDHMKANKKVPNNNFSSTPKKLKDRVEKLLTENQNQSIKYIK